MLKLTFTNLVAIAMLFGITQLGMCDQCDDTRMGPAPTTVGALTGDTLPPS